MGMKLSNVSGIQTPDQQKSSLGGIFGSDFQKWSQIVYLPEPLAHFFCPSFSFCVCVFVFCDLRTVVDDSDTQNSRLRFSGKAILHSEGVDFSSGQSFSLRLSDLELQEELGKGNYGTVVHVIHRVTNAHMAMKQIKLELDNSKFMAIITELQVLHEAKTDLIVDFYGGFFAESCVFICMEYVTPPPPDPRFFLLGMVGNGRWMEGVWINWFLRVWEFGMRRFLHG